MIKSLYGIRFLPGHPGEPSPERIKVGMVESAGPDLAFGVISAAPRRIRARQSEGTDADNARLLTLRGFIPKPVAQCLAVLPVRGIGGNHHVGYPAHRPGPLSQASPADQSASLFSLGASPDLGTGGKTLHGKLIQRSVFFHTYSHFTSECDFS